MGALQDQPELLARILAAIDLNRLVLFCGAGLSFGRPSAVPTATSLAAESAIRYDAKVLPLALPADARADLEILTNFLFQQGHKNLFIRELVNWTPFRGKHNKGHLAVADFLSCHAIEFAITTNYDTLIESAAQANGESDPEPSLDGPSIAKHRPHKPLLKIHGCVMDKDHTLWCKRQLRNPRLLDPADAELRTRIRSLRLWIRENLSERDLIFVGFWSDWAYLNHTLSMYLKSVHGHSLILVDPQEPAALQTKAPDLWKWASIHGANFFHVRESGDAFLEELRAAFSRTLLEKVLRAALPAIAVPAPGAAPLPTDFAAVNADDLYSLRRDFSGVPVGEVPRFKRPDGMDAVGRAHLLLRKQSAQLNGSSYVDTAGARIRVVNGQTRLLSDVRKRFSEEPPRPIEDNYVICAGAEDDGNAKTDIVRGESPADIVRPGSSAHWLTLQSAQSLNLC